MNKLEAAFFQQTFMGFGTTFPLSEVSEHAFDYGGLKRSLMVFKMFEFLPNLKLFVQDFF